MRTANRNAEELTGEHIARGLTAADDGRTRAINARVRPLRTAKTELQHLVSARRLHHTGRLGSDQGLVIDDVQQRRFQQLCFHDRRDDAENRLIREDDRSFRHREDFAGKVEIAQIGQEGIVKDRKATKILDVLLRKAKILDILNDLLKARSDGIGRHIAAPAIEEIEACTVFVLTVAQITVHHRQLIQVGHHR